MGLYLRLLFDVNGIRGAYLREAVENSSTDFNLDYLTIDGAGHDAPAALHCEQPFRGHLLSKATHYGGLE